MPAWCPLSPATVAQLDGTCEEPRGTRFLAAMDRDLEVAPTGLEHGHPLVGGPSSARLVPRGRAVLGPILNRARQVASTSRSTAGSTTADGSSGSPPEPVEGITRGMQHGIDHDALISWLVEDRKWKTPEQSPPKVLVDDRV